MRSDSTSKKAAIQAGGRPQKVDKRDTRHILRQLKLLRSTEPNWTVKRLMEKSGIKGVSVRTVNRLLNENGYQYVQARKKGLLSEKDRQTRFKFAKNTYKCHRSNFWTEKVAFYFDGVSFAYKRNPKSQAQAPAGKVWCRSNEGLKSGCTAKGSKCGTGGKYLRLIVAISYAKGVVACVPYQKWTENILLPF